MNPKPSAPPRSRRGFRGVALVADPNEDYGREVEWLLTRAGFAVVRTREVNRSLTYVERELSDGNRDAVPDLLVTAISDTADDRRSWVAMLTRVASVMPVVVTTASDLDANEIRDSGASAMIVERSSSIDVLRKVLAEAGREWLSRSHSCVSS